MSKRDILARGYFPKELPNPFNTVSFAASVTAAGVVLPSGFVLDTRVQGGGIPVSAAARYSHARGGLLRRALSIPNPVNQHALATEIDSNWTALQAQIGGTTLSATRPVLGTTGRAIQAFYARTMGPVSSAQTRQNRRYILKTDVSLFYQSIYTHSVPWAIHGKPFAKSNRGLAHLGNRIDLLLRSAQEQQTIGVPIGPDTSLVIAEALLQASDRDLLQLMPDVRGHRYLDDYELAFRSRTDAENAYHVLGSVLSRYELTLNAQKTRSWNYPHN
jgi:hypothetical protein